MIVLGGLILLAVRLAGGACPAPKLVLEVSSPAPKQGSIVAVVLRSDAPLSRAMLSDGRHEIAMERDDEGALFRALVGIDFDSAAGAQTFAVEAIGACADAHRVSRTLAVVSGRFPTQELEVAPAYVEPPAYELNRIRDDKEKVERIWAAPEDVRRWNAAFRLPVRSATAGHFGSRRVFNGKPRSPHDGVDMGAPQGTEVAAPAAAVVALAETLYFSGGTVILNHGGGLFTTYFHLSSIDVKPAEAVDAGQRIGAVGATGRATGPHLHWGARLHRARVNPLDLLQLPTWQRPTEKPA